jgi:hypothetical protein
MPDIPMTIVEIDDRVAALRENLREWSSKLLHTPALRTRT